MKVLTQGEINQIDGGVAPLIGAAIAVYSHFTASTLTGAVLSRVGLAVAVYGLGEYLSES